MAFRSLSLTLLLAGTAALTAGCAGQPANQAPVVHRPLFAYLLDNDVVAPRAPPPALSEPTQVRRGYIRVRPYWKWDGHDFVEVPGEWIPQRVDYRYADAYWERHANGWHFRPAVWYAI